MKNSVSVVIPTVGRESLYSAVESAILQTTAPLEVVVCADTLKPLHLPDDDRIRVVRVGPNAGGNVARQTGIEASRGDYIALLDDDDIWLANKLSHQLAQRRKLNLEKDGHWLLTTRVIDTDGKIRPLQEMRSGDDPIDVLFRRTKFREGTGKLHTSTWFFPRSFGMENIFDPNIRFHQDLDWIVCARQNFGSFTVEQSAFADTVCGETDGSVAKTISWRGSADWCLDKLGTTSSRIRGDFLVHVSFSRALSANDPKVAFSAFKFAVQNGRPGFYGFSTSLIKLVRLCVSSLSKNLRAK